MYRLGIIGAGPGGAAAAYAVNRKARELGHKIEVTVLEKADRVGGKLFSVTTPMGIIERGAEAVVLKDSRLRGIFEELGLSLLPPSPLPFGILSGSRIESFDPTMLRPFPKNVRPLLTTPLFSTRGKLRAAWGMARARFNRTGTDLDLPLGRALEQVYGREVASVLGTILGNIYGSSVASLSAEIYFPSLLRRGGSRASFGGASMVSFAEGMETLVLRLLECSGARVLTGCSIRVLRSDGHRWIAEGLEGRRFEFDGVVVTPPGGEGLHLLRDLNPIFLEYGDAVSKASGATVTFLFPSIPLPELTGVLVPLREDGAVTGVTFVSQKWVRHGPGDQVAVRVFVRGEQAARDPASYALRFLRQRLGIAGAPTDQYLDVWTDAFVTHGVGSVSRAQVVRDVAKCYPGLFLSWGGLVGTGIADAISAGLDCANDVAHHYGSMCRLVADADEEKGEDESKGGVHESVPG